MPLVALLPAQPFDAIQVVASVDDHISVELDPLASELGLALRVTVGGGVVTGGLVTVTVAEAWVLAVALEQTSVKVLVEVSTPVLSVPLVDFVPDHAPDAEHCVAFVDDHVNIAVLPLIIDCGLAASVMLGLALACEVAGGLLSAPPPHALNRYALNSAVVAHRIAGHRPE